MEFEIERKRIEDAIRKKLAAKGLTETEANADGNVRFTLGAANRREVERYPAGWRGWETRRVAVRYTEGTLIIDMRDPRRQELVWRAIAVEDHRDPSKLQSTRGS